MTLKVSTIQLILNYLSILKFCKIKNFYGSFINYLAFKILIDNDIEIKKVLKVFFFLNLTMS